jgi:hypothetical protein
VSSKDDKQHELGLVLGPDGKKNVWLVNQVRASVRVQLLRAQTGLPLRERRLRLQAGRRSSVPSKSIELVLAGSGYTQDSLAQFTAAADAAAGDAASMLELAHAIAAEDCSGPNTAPLSLSQLCQLLFGSSSAQQQFTAFTLLLADGVFFKAGFKGGVWSFTPRDAAAVEAAAAAAAAEAAEAAAQQAFLQAWAAASDAAARARPNVQEQRQQWLAGPHGERVQALLVRGGVTRAWCTSAWLQPWRVKAPPVCSSPSQDLALKAPDKPPKPSEALARDTLALLKRRPEPDVAASVLQAAGLLQLHEPLPVLRLGHTADGAFPPRLEAAAQVGEGCGGASTPKQALAHRP